MTSFDPADVSTSPAGGSRLTSSNGKHDFLDTPDNPDDLGTLGSYRVLSQIGRGGMGFVFRAEDKRLKRTVALKVMNKRVAATPHSRARFISEARAMAAVHHDNVATIFEVGEHSGTPFMAMEMLKGQTLEEFKQSKERPSFEKIIRFAKETAKGLAAAHAQGIVHRDIKPANIWVEEGTERVKILDFGLALAQTPVDQLSGRGSVVGTPGYLSPEQARTEPLDDRSDLYSLGVVLYELATGKLPLRSATVAGQLIAILAHQPQPIREINDKIPAPLADLIYKLLSKEARNRVNSAAELVQLLEQVAIDCESKSEVALAINKLQMGLQEVVKKKQQPAEQPQPIVPVRSDPFASLPSTPVATLPPANPLAAAPSPAAAPMRPRTAGQKPNKKTQTAPPILKYWPVAAGLLVLVIGGLAFMFAGPSSDRETAQQIVPIEQDPDPAPKTTPQRPQNNKQPGATASQQPKSPAVATKQPGKQPGKQPDSKPKSKPNSKPKPKKPKPKPEPKVETVAVVTQQPDRSPVEPTPVSTPPPADPPPPEPARKTEVVVISSAQGRGADATVKKGASIRESLGEKPNLVVQSRAGIELQHAYIRFDLESLAPGGNQNAGPGGQRGGGNKKDQDRKTGKVELMLHCMDGSAQGASLRVYGANNPNSERWLEEEGPFALTWTKSFSEAGLESLPLLAEVPRVAVKGDLVTISAPELAEFVRTTPLSSVTLILAGGKANKPIQFVSRNGDEAQAQDCRSKSNLDGPLAINRPHEHHQLANILRSAIGFVDQRYGQVARNRKVQLGEVWIGTGINHHVVSTRR